MPDTTIDHQLHIAVVPIHETSVRKVLPVARREHQRPVSRRLLVGMPDFQMQMWGTDARERCDDISLFHTCTFDEPAAGGNMHIDGVDRCYTNPV